MATPLFDGLSRLDGGMIVAGGSGVLTLRLTWNTSMKVLVFLICYCCKDPVTGWIAGPSSRFEQKSSRSLINSEDRRRELTVVASTRKEKSSDLEATSTTTAASAEATESQKLSYNLGLGKNKPKVADAANSDVSDKNATSAALNWLVPESVVKPPVSQPLQSISRLASSVASLKSANITGIRTRRMVA